MKRFCSIILSIVFLAVSLNASAQRGHRGSHSYSSHSTSHTNRSEEHVSGYTKKNGTYVEPHYRSAPNSTQKDNWSSKGNVNPHTGKVGTKEPKY